jgi:hypothetical protein
VADEPKLESQAVVKAAQEKAERIRRLKSFGEGCDCDESVFKIGFCSCCKPTRKRFLGLFGKRYCTDPECPHSIESMRAIGSLDRSWISKKFSSVMAYLRNRFVDRIHIVRLGLKPGEWCDADERMLLAMMSLLVEFVEQEVGLERLTKEADLNSDFYGEAVCDEERKGNERNAVQALNVLIIYHWWKNYPKRQQELMDALPEYAGDPLDYNKMFADPEWRKQSDRHYEMEERLERETQQMLHKLIDIRGGLWT